MFASSISMRTAVLATVNLLFSACLIIFVYSLNDDLICMSGTMTNISDFGAPDLSNLWLSFRCSLPIAMSWLSSVISFFSISSVNKSTRSHMRIGQSRAMRALSQYPLLLIGAPIDQDFAPAGMLRTMTPFL